MLPKNVEILKNMNSTIGKFAKWYVRIIDPKIIQYEFKPRGETETEMRQGDGDAPGSASAIAEEDPVSKNEQPDKKVAGFVEKPRSGKTRLRAQCEVAHGEGRKGRET